MRDIYTPDFGNDTTLQAWAKLPHLGHVYLEEGVEREGIPVDDLPPHQGPSVEPYDNDSRLPSSIT